MRAIFAMQLGLALLGGAILWGMGHNAASASYGLGVMTVFLAGLSGTVTMFVLQRRARALKDMNTTLAVLGMVQPILIKWIVFISLTLLIFIKVPNVHMLGLVVGTAVGTLSYIGGLWPQYKIKH